MSSNSVSSSSNTWPGYTEAADGSPCADAVRLLIPAQRMAALFYLGAAGWLAVAAVGAAFAG